MHGSKLIPGFMGHVAPPQPQQAEGTLRARRRGQAQHLCIAQLGLFVYVERN